MGTFYCCPLNLRIEHTTPADRRFYVVGGGMTNSKPHNMDAIIINSTQLLLGRIYDSVGFNQIPDGIHRHLVIARVSQPRSKLATVSYLKSYYDEDVDLNHIGTWTSSTTRRKSWCSKSAWSTPARYSMEK